MRSRRRLFPVDNPCSRLLPWLWLFCLTLAGQPAIASTLAMQVGDGQGGRIASAGGKIDCTLNCLVGINQGMLSSLFAVADQGYRFQAWDGVCANTLGPLCTVKVTGDAKLGARFVKTEASKKTAKALLLLHGEGERHSVWNEFVKQRFNNRCPMIYGGVVLGEDSYDPRNKVYCYRIAFGYYDLLKQNLASPLNQTAGRTSNKDGFSSKLWGYEIRAALLGVLERHPNLHLALVGQARAALAAQAYLRANSAESSHVVGLLALQPSNHSGAESTGLAQRGRINLLTLSAAPEQEARISAGLGRLTQSWWLAQ